MNIFNDIKNLRYKEQLVDLGLDPFECFKRIYCQSQNCFFLESLGEEDLYSRFAYIGFDPKVILSGIDTHSYAEIANLSKMNVTGLPEKGFAGGLVGYFGHESARYFDPAFVVGKHPDFPDFELGLYLDGLMFDRIGRRELYFTVQEDRLRKIKKLLHKPVQLKPFQSRRIKTSKTKQQHRDMVLFAKERIAAGDIFQAVLSIGYEYEVSGDPIAVYEQLRKINPSAHMFFFKFGPRVVFGASPELLIDVEGNVVRHRGTLAGTIRRGRDAAEDMILAQHLLSDEKEKAEHMMLVDLARNDMGKICEFGSVALHDLLHVKKFSHVQHLSSEITGILNKGESAFTALSACFPAGTLSGAPKIEAMKIIHELEKSPRGPYGGVGGYFSLNGSSMQCINIRSFAVSGNRGFMQIGSGIVADSKPELEYQEICNKGQAMRMALEKA